MNDRWQFDWLTSWDEIRAPAFAAQWQRFADESFNSHVFFHPALGWAWLDTYLPLRDLRPCFLIARRSEHTVFLPVVHWRKNWKNAFQRVLVPLGYSDYDYHDPLVTGPAETMDWVGFWTGLLENLTLRPPCQFDRFELGGVRAEHTEGALAWEDDEVCPWIDLTPFRSIEEYLATVSKGLRGDIGRQKRRLADQGQVSYNVYTADELPGALTALDAFLHHHAVRWPNAYRAPHFHENLLRKGLPAGTVYFSTMALGNRAVSWRLSFAWKNRYCSYQPTIDAAFSSYSPGKVHQCYVVSDLIGKRYATFDFLRGAEAHKAGWANGETRLKRATLARSSVASSLRNSWVDHGKHGLARLVNNRSSDVQSVKA